MLEIVSSAHRVPRAGGARCREDGAVRRTVPCVRTDLAVSSTDEADCGLEERANSHRSLRTRKPHSFTGRNVRPSGLQPSASDAGSPPPPPPPPASRASVRESRCVSYTSAPPAPPAPPSGAPASGRSGRSVRQGRRATTSSAHSAAKVKAHTLPSHTPRSGRPAGQPSRLPRNQPRGMPEA